MTSALRLAARLLSGNDCRPPEGFAWGALTYADTARLRAELVKRFAPATCNRVLSAVRGVLREAWRLDLMNGDAHAKAASVESVRLTGLVRGRVVGIHEIARLVQACADDDSPAGVRDGACVALLFGAGLRRAEAVSVDVDDFSSVRGSLCVRRGKGGRGRVVFVGAGGVGAVEAWLSVRGRAPGPLLVRVGRKGTITHTRLTASAVWWMLHRRQQQAGLDRFSPHDLRRSMVTLALDAGADLGAVQRLAGHRQVNTTLRYDHRGQVVERRAAGLLPWVFVGGYTSADEQLLLLAEGKSTP